MSDELDDALYEKVQYLSGEGNELADEENYLGAIEKFAEALAMLPEPKNKWEAATWLLTSIGDMHYELKDFGKASGALYDALNCAGGIENPFIYLRLGQSLLEIGNVAAARENLMKAYMLVGDEIFDGEDPKYFDAIKDLL